MTFINDSGNVLEVQGDFAMTKQAVSIFNFNLKGDVSINFNLPNTAEVRKALGYFGANMLGSVAASRSAWTAMKDGNRWAKGFIYISNDESESLDCYFSSGNGNWFNLLQSKLSDYDYESYIKLFTDVATSSEGIDFPIVDWAYAGKRLSKSFIQSTGCFAVGDFQERFPCFYLYSIIDEVTRKSGIKITGDILDDFNFKSIVVTPTGPELQYPAVAIADNLSFVKLGSNEAFTQFLTLIPFDTVIDEGGLNFDTTTSRYTAYRTATHRVYIDLDVDTSQTYVIYIYVNGVLAKPVSSGISIGSGLKVISFEYVNLTKGDYLEIFTSANASPYNMLAGSSVRIEINKDIKAILYDGVIGLSYPTVSYVNPASIVPDIKAIDLIKFITFYFGCVCTFDEYTNTIEINRVDNIIDEEDWSDYFISSKNNYSQQLGTNNYITTQEPKEETLIDFNRKNKTNYGGGNIETDYVNIAERELYKMPFAPADDPQSKTSLAWFMPYIKFYDLKEDTTKVVTVTAVTDNGSGIARFACTNVFAVCDIIYINSGTYLGYGIVSVINAAYFELYGVTFNETSSALDLAIKIKYTPVSGGNRLLFVLPNYDIENAGGPATFDYLSDVGLATTTTSGTADVAFYDKPKINNVLDGFRQSLAIKNIPSKEYNNTIGDQYQSKFHTVMNNPAIVATMILPESKFISFNFRKKIYINSERLTGSFLVDSITDYVDSNTPVDMKLYML